MARYVTRTKAVADCEWWEGARPSVPTVTEAEATDTGILDADGNEIWRRPNPIGFGRDDEW